MFRSRKAQRELDKRRRRLVEDFAGWLSSSHQDRLPRPGYYVPIGEQGWTYLEGETEQMQDNLTDHIGDDTIFAVGVWAEGSGPGNVTVAPRLVVLPERFATA